MTSDLQRIWPVLQASSAVLASLPRNQWSEAAGRFFTADGVRRALAFVRMIEAECRMDIRGKTVIDAGCGLGQNTILLALLGAGKVYGVDIDEERMAAFSHALEQWRRICDEMDRVELVVADIMAYTPARKADLVISIEMLSHLWDRKAFYGRVAGMLGGGGRFFASDGNNGANRRIAAERKSKWRVAETPGGRIFEARKRFILDRFPALTDANPMLHHLTLHTCYQRPDELVENVGEYLASGQLRRACGFSDDRAPYDPEYCFLPNEDLLYPDHEARRIRAAGLQPRIIPYFMGANRQYLRPINRLLGSFPALSIPFARGLHIVATKI